MGNLKKEMKLGSWEVKHLLMSMSKAALADFVVDLMEIEGGHGEDASSRAGFALVVHRRVQPVASLRGDRVPSVVALNDLRRKRGLPPIAGHDIEETQARPPEGERAPAKIHRQANDSRG